MTDGLKITIDDTAVRAAFGRLQREDRRILRRGGHARGYDAHASLASRADLAERERILETLAATRGNMTKAARLPGIAKSTSYVDLDEHDLHAHVVRAARSERVRGMRRRGAAAHGTTSSIESSTGSLRFTSTGSDSACRSPLCAIACPDFDTRAPTTTCG